MQQEQKDSKLVELDSLLPTFKIIKHNCLQHGIVDAKVMEFNGVENLPNCPVCLAKSNQEKEKLAEERELQIKTQHQRRIIEARLDNAMIPIRFQQHSFDTYEEKSVDHKKKKQLCLDYAKNFLKKQNSGTSIIFSGTTGTGKTHLACAIANYIILNHDKTAVFISVLNAVRRVKETYRKGSQETEREAIRWFLNPDLLILDEVGVQFGSDTEKMVLFEIINQRYENLKPTILLSNFSAENLKEFIGDRIMDRMKEGGGMLLNFTMSSYRS